jgi:hypothetical protein
VYSAVLNFDSKFQVGQKARRKSRRCWHIDLMNAQPPTLLKSTSAAKILLSGGCQDVAYGESNIYVGDIPGLAALNGIDVDSPPSAVFGMDVLRKRPKMLMRARDQEVYVRRAAPLDGVAYT